jgi:site-specific recombinase XerC
MTSSATTEARKLPQAAVEYLEVLRLQRRMSPHTLAAYRCDLESLVSLAGATAIEQLSRDCTWAGSRRHRWRVGCRRGAAFIAGWGSGRRWP